MPVTGADHAVVLGAGIAGLLAALVLAEHYAQVTVVERDPLPEPAGARRGVPQGRQINGLESRGVQVLDELLPGLTDELAASGAGLIDDLAQMHYRVDDRLMTSRPTRIHPFLLVTRPFLEDAVRRRVRALPAVTIRDGTEVSGLLHRPGPDGAVVTGVRLSPAGGGPATDLAADLVLDATGRGSRASVWLGELGYPKPAEERIAVKITYATRALRLPDSAALAPFLIEGTSLPGQASISLFQCEQGRTLFGLSGPREAFPSPVTGEWMLTVAQDRLSAPALEAVRAADEAGPISVHQVPASVWRRYDQLRRFPPGLLVLGDAICAFNPVYGQGSSTATWHALLLRDALRAGPGDLPRRFFAAAAKPAARAWRLASGPDLARAGGPASAERVAAWVTGKLLSQAFRVAQHDAEVARSLTAVTGLSEGRGALLRPRVLLPVAASASTMALRRLASIGAGR